MNILAVQESDWIENLPLQSHHIMERLASRGHNVRVIDFEARWERGSHPRVARTKVYDNVSRTNAGSGVRLLRPGMVRLPGISRLSSFLTQFKEIFTQMAEWCDVVVLYSVPTNGVQTVLSSMILSKPIVFHSFDVLHRMVEHSFLQPPTWALERFVYLRTRKVVVISAALETYMKTVGVSPQNIVLLPPAVDTDRFRPETSKMDFRNELGVSSEDKVVLFSGWLYEFSGLDYLMKSMHEILRKVPNMKLIICGNGPLYLTLCRLREELNLESHVMVLGKRPFEQMPKIVASSDVCINPYFPDIRSYFAFPSKIAEYLAAGKPVLATGLPGTRTFLGDDSGTTLVPPEQFISALEVLLLDDSRRQQSGRMARKFCEQNFSLDSVSETMERILRNVISNRTSG